MKKRFLTKKWLLIAILVCAAAGTAVAVRHFRGHDRMVFAVSEWWYAHEYKNRSLWLPDYRVALEIQVEGVDRNLSGLTWNNDTKTLFAVTNNPPRLIELTTDGKPLRRIALHDFHDTEAVEYIGDNHYIIAEEQKQDLSLVTIDAHTTELRAEERRQRISLSMGKAGNKGLEGLAWDFAAKRLYVAKERDPIHIYEVGGFPHAPNTTLDIVVGQNRERDSGLFVADVSGLDFSARFQHLLVLSDESKLIVELDKQGRPISSLPLDTRAGFSRAIPQAEGIALDDQDNLYLASEPNLFYVLRKTGE